MIQKKDLNNSFLFSKVLSIYLVINTINLAISLLFSNVVILSIKTIVLGLSFLLFYMHTYKNKKDVWVELCFFEFVFFVICLISILFNTNIVDKIIDRCIWTFVFCIPVFVSARTVNNTDDILDNIIPASLVTLFFSTVVYAYLYKNMDFQYVMSFGYNLLLPSIVFFENRRKKWLYPFLFIFSTLLIVAVGSRGPLLGLGVYLLISVLLSKQTKINVKIFWSIIITLVAIFYDVVLNYLSKFIKTIGINSRTLSLLVNGDFINDSGRLNIWKFALEKIGEKPLIGWGICGELQFMSVYPHMLFIELMIDFGLVIGVFLTIYVMYKMLHSLWVTKCSNFMVLSLICTGVIPLLLSGSYLQGVLFWAFMGVSSSYTLTKRRLRFYV